jgi:hypothetical protein
MARNLSIRTPTPKVLPDDTLETHYSGLERMQPHACYEGFVYIGHMVEDESGEPTEEIERVPCRRCQAAYETFSSTRVLIDHNQDVGAHLSGDSPASTPLTCVGSDALLS